MQTAASACGKSTPQKHRGWMVLRESRNDTVHTWFWRKVQRRCWNGDHVGQQVDIKVDVGLGELRHIATEAHKTYCASKMFWCLTTGPHGTASTTEVQRGFHWNYTACICLCIYRYVYITTWFHHFCRFFFQKVFPRHFWHTLRLLKGINRLSG